MAYRCEFLNTDSNPCQRPAGHEGLHNCTSPDYRPMRGVDYAYGNKKPETSVNAAQNPSVPRIETGNIKLSAAPSMESVEAHKLLTEARNRKAVDCYRCGQFASGSYVGEADGHVRHISCSPVGLWKCKSV